MRHFCIGMIFVLSFLSCQDSIELVSLSEDVDVRDEEIEEKEEQIFIVDQTGKEWNITHAVNKYDFHPERFMFGLGPDAIQPILKPQMLSPGDPGYPENGAGFTILGTSFNGLPRAYSLSVMSSHEVVDEVFDTAHVAVAY